MSRVTSKLQVTIPKAVADRFGIRPGDDVEWEPAGETVRVVPRRQARPAADLASRLRLFDEASQRQDKRGMGSRYPGTSGERGWKREDLYDRGLPR